MDTNEMTNQEKARALTKFALAADKQATINSIHSAELSCNANCEMHHEDRLSKEQSAELREWIDLINSDL